MTTTSQSDSTCCPVFDPIPWDDRIVKWENKKFIKDKVCTLFYMPINFGKVMKRIFDLFSKASADVPDYLCLSDHTSRWNMDIYLATDREISGAQNTTISGKFYCKVYEGSFKDTGKWCDDSKTIAQQKGYTIKKWYMWYTTCPKCAKKYGKNYVVIIGQVE
ncbi:hydrolase [uncultured Acetobacteroides sp.]|uniref:hydrolase n=1 Tax=uncultured Acetobacteroides sp. TaxID=1760811 RepID=UPI0029F46192|nr:hydrolase [uncultured Acetobacteroides sp.]